MRPAPTRSIAPALAGAAMVLFAVAVPAQISTSLQGAAGFIRAERKNGLALSLGVAGATHRFVLFATPVDVGITTGAPDRHFRREPSSFGYELCRDTRTNLLVDQQYCRDKTTAFYGASADVNIVVYTSGRRAIFLGGGYRAGRGAGPYVSAGVGFHPFSTGTYFIRGALGEDVIQLSVGATRRIGRR